MIWSETGAGFIYPDGVSGRYPDEIDAIVCDVERDTPGFDELPESLRTVVSLAIQKGAALGFDKGRDTSYGALSDLTPDEIEELTDDIMGQVGIEADSPYVTHHDVRRAAVTAMNRTVEFVKGGLEG